MTAIQTGPDYPRDPVAGSNAIGVGAIGVMQIGDIAAFDYWRTVMSQYANSPILTSIIGSFFAAADQTQNFIAFYDDIWNVETATGYGLDVWGRIVGVGRVIEVVTDARFGFEEALPGSLSFNTGGSVQGGGTFYSGAGLTSSYQLSDESYRLLIMAKAAANISDGSIPSINRILLNLFPNRGNAYVTDGNQNSAYFGFQESQTALTFGQGIFYNGTSLNNIMSMTYTFRFQLSPVEYAIVSNSGVLPKPTGVAASIVIL